MDHRTRSLPPAITALAVTVLLLAGLLLGTAVVTGGVTSGDSSEVAGARLPLLGPDWEPLPPPRNPPE